MKAVSDSSWSAVGFVTQGGTMREVRERPWGNTEGNHSFLFKYYSKRNNKIHVFEVSIFQADSICLTGQVVLNISQFSQRTVELLRTT